MNKTIRTHIQEQIVDLEGVQNAVPSQRIRIDPHDDLVRQVFERIGHQAILAQHHDGIVGAEYEIR